MSRNSKRQTPEAESLACALLSDGARMLFLKQTDRLGIERIGLPSVFIQAGQNPVEKMAEAFLEQTGIDGQVHETIFQSTYNVGSRKRKKFIPVLAFKVTAKSAQAKPSREFSGFCWSSMEDARKRKLFRSSEWIVRV